MQIALGQVDDLALDRRSVVKIGDLESRHAVAQETHAYTLLGLTAPSIAPAVLQIAGRGCHHDPAAELSQEPCEARRITSAEVHPEAHEREMPVAIDQSNGEPLNNQAVGKVDSELLGARRRHGRRLAVRSSASEAFRRAAASGRGGKGVAVVGKFAAEVPVPPAIVVNRWLAILNQLGITAA